MTLAEQLIEEGRVEGRRQSALIGQVEMLHRLLGRPAEEDSVLAAMPNHRLEAMLVSLERECKERLQRD